MKRHDPDRKDADPTRRTLRPSPAEEREFAEDLARDSHGRQHSTMADLVADDAAPLSTPVEEPHVDDPEPHRQHARKGRAESPREKRE